MVKNQNSNKKLSNRFYLSVVYISKILFIISILLLIGWIIFKSNFADFLEVNIEWEIEKNSPIDESILINRISPIISKNKYLLNLSKIKQSLENEPWVDKVYIKRLFWNNIKINVSIHKVAIRLQNIDCDDINQKNCLGYISTKGKIFIPDKLVQVDNPLALAKFDPDIIYDLYLDFKNYQAILGAIAIKSITRTNIDKLTIMPNIKIILGYDKQNQRLKRFIKIYNRIQNKKRIKNATFDMRYSKGFALSY
jgi:cell division protein FtsQ